MALGHDKIETSPILLIVLTLLTVAVGGLVEIVPLYFQKSTTEPVQGLQPYNALQIAGRDVYLREGCYNCHSQMIRPMRAETLRYGPYSVAGESVWDHPFQWVSKRTGEHCGESDRGSGSMASARATRPGSCTEPADTRRSRRRRGACRNGCNRSGGAGTRPAPPFLRLTELRPEPAARPPPAVRGLREIPGTRHRRSRCS